MNAVSSRPEYMKKSEMMSPERGPAMEKSNRDFRFVEWCNGTGKTSLK